MKLLGLLLVLSAACSAQIAPHPFVAAGASLQDTAGGAGVAGIDWNLFNRIRTVDEAGYETGGKSDDNVNNTSQGHTRYLRGEALVSLPGHWAIGPGLSWSKLYTPAYSKSSVHPRIAVQLPWTAAWTRAEIQYVHPGTDWMNGVQGFEFYGWWQWTPHIFLRIMGGGYWAHETVTDRTNALLTAEQKSKHVPTSQAQFLLGWRF